MSLLKAGATTPVVLVSEIRYHPSGAVQSWTWGNSTAAVPNHYFREFDSQGRITRLPFGNILHGGVIRTITYDAAGRITKTEHVGSGLPGDLAASLNQSYGYDDLDRLISFNGNGTSARYQYDASGNRIQLAYGGQTFLNIINPASNQLQKITGPTSSKIYNYDAAGNLFTDGTINYVYNARGRMQSAQSGAITVTYKHNGHGQRAAKLVKTGSSSNSIVETTYFAYDESGQLLGNYDKSGKSIEETIHLGDLPIITFKLKNPTPETGIETYYIYSDQINTARVITNSTNNSIVWRWDQSDPFGATSPNDISQTGNFTYHRRFPGQYYDNETNLYYNYYRNFDPKIGRFIESDPIGLNGGINTYRYGLNNPLIFSDPLGLDATRILNTTGSRKYWHGPTNGNWGGQCWSGGKYSCGTGRSMGDLPPTDSADSCYKMHDECYESPSCNTSDSAKNKIGIKNCDAALVQCLKNLPYDPTLWINPPKPGTEEDTKAYRDGAILWFQ